MDSRRCVTRRVVLTGGAALAAARAMPAWAQAPGFPVRPVQLVVAAPAGGPSDGLARMLADDMSRLLGQPLVIDNKPGVSGAVAADFVHRAPPDGYTLMMSWIGNATGQALIPKLSFDINRDFSHITHIANIPTVLVVHPGTGLRSFKDFVAAAKARPGRLSYASAGNGSSGHLAMEMLKQRAGVAIVHIPYRGGAAAVKDLLEGRIDAMFINQDAVIPHAKTGAMVPLACASSARSRILPEVPTVAESGYPGFEATAWAGLSAPRGVPGAVLERLHATAVQAIQGQLKVRQEALGAQVIASTPAAFSAFVRHETEKWAQVIKTAGIKAD